jgi:glycosyltransferase involved in cell wall biosynthesis
VVKSVVFAVPGDLATPTGGYAYDRRIVRELAAHGWNVEVLDLGDSFPLPSAAERIAAGARLAALPADRPVVVDGLAFGALPDAAEALHSSHQVVALVHHPLALETGLSSDEAATLRASECAALSCARHVIATSAATARLLVTDFAVSLERLTVVRPGTDRAALATRDGKATVSLLAVGSVVPRKGYDVLLEALARLADLPWRAVIVGDRTRSPETARQLDAEVLRVGLVDRVTFAGAVAPENLAAYYTGADLFVLPSRFEGYGMAYAEALAHGLPVIGTTAGAIPETVPAGARVLVRPDDVQALATALRHLIENPHERRRLAQGACTAAAQLPSWEAQAALFGNVLESLA